MSRWVLVLSACALLVAGCEYDVAGVAPNGAADAGGVVLPDGALADIDAAAEPDASPAGPDATPPLPCPDNYPPAGAFRSSYRLGGFLLDWRTAEGACEDDGIGTHLVVIDDAAELAHVISVASGVAVWVGVSDRVDEGTFLNVFGAEPTFTPWRAGEPNDDGIFGEDCVELRDGLYNDRSCSSLQRYVCECDGLDIDPTAY